MSRDPELEALVEAAARGFAAGLLAAHKRGEASQYVERVQTAAEQKSRPEATNLETPPPAPHGGADPFEGHKPEIPAILREPYVPLDPRGDEADEPPPNLADLDALFGSVPPGENEAVDNLRRQMAAQRSAASIASSSLLEGGGNAVDAFPTVTAAGEGGVRVPPGRRREAPATDAEMIAKVQSAGIPDE